MNLWIRPTTSGVFWSRRKSLKDAAAKINAVNYRKGEKFFVVRSTSDLYKIEGFKLDEEIFKWVDYPKEVTSLVSIYEFNGTKLIRTAWEV